MFTYWLVDFTGNFGLSLLVLEINGLDEFVKGWEAGRFLIVYHLILDASGKVFISLVKEGRVALLEMHCKMIKLNEVKSHLRTFKHTQYLNLCLGLSYWVK